VGFTEWFERHFGTKEDPLPWFADVVVGVGFALSRDGTECSLATLAVARRANELWSFYSGRQPESRPFLVLQGRGYKRDMPTTEARAMREAIGFYSPRIILEEISYNTRMNAVEFARLAKEQGWRAAVVVAQQWHARRVRLAYRKALREAEVDCRIKVVKAWAPYGGINKWFLNWAPWFWLWDTLSLGYFKLKGWI